MVKNTRYLQRACMFACLVLFCAHHAVFHQSDDEGMTQSLSSLFSFSKIAFDDDDDVDDTRKRYRYQRNKVARLFCNDSFPVVNSTTAQRQRLEFLHIPKTAGGTIRQAAAAHDIAWGACHWVRCDKNGDVHKDIPLKNRKERPVKHPQWGVSFWHLPPQYYTKISASSWIPPSSSFSSSMVLSPGTKKHYYYSPYKNANLFIVVRHPYSRIVSQWNWMAAKNLHDGTLNATQKMNADLDKVLTEMAAMMTTTTSLQNDNAPKPQPFIKYGGHFIPQAEYLNDQVTTVLRYEYLDQDFDCMLRKYGLPSTLSLYNYQVTHPRPPGSLTVNDLDASVRQKIARVYQKDFEYFGYHAW